MLQSSLSPAASSPLSTASPAHAAMLPVYGLRAMQQRQQQSSSSSSASPSSPSSSSSSSPPQLLSAISSTASLAFTTFQQQQRAQQQTSMPAVSAAPSAAPAGTASAAASAASASAPSSPSSSSSSSIVPCLPAVAGAALSALHAGSYFKKHDWSGSVGLVQTADVFLFLSGSGRSACLYWCSAVQASARPMLDRQCLAIRSITDFMLRKKTDVLRATAAADDCCFALVSSSGLTLHVEAANAALCSLWKEGLMSCLSLTGKLIKRVGEGQSTRTANAVVSSSSPPAAGHRRHRSAVALSSPSSASSPPVSSPSSAQSPNGPSTPVKAFFASPAAAPVLSLPASPSASAAESLMRAGEVFTVYGKNHRREVEREAMLVFYSGSRPADAGQQQAPAPGIGWLCWTSPVSRKPVPGQELWLGSVVSLSWRKETSVLKSPLAAAAPADCCFSILTASTTLNLEATSVDTVARWMLSMQAVFAEHSIRVSIASMPSPPPAVNGAAGPQQQQQQQLCLSPSSSSPVSSASAPLSPSSPPVSPSLSWLPSGLASLLVSGSPFKIFYISKGVASTADILLFLTPDASPAAPPPAATPASPEPSSSSSPSPCLYWCPLSSRERRKRTPSQRLPVVDIVRLVQGKETSIFRHSIAANAPPELCLSVVGKSLTLNLQAAEQHTRNDWHAALTLVIRHQHALAQQQQQQQASTASTRSSTPVASRDESPSSPAPLTPLSPAADNGAQLSAASAPAAAAPTPAEAASVAAASPQRHSGSAGRPNPIDTALSRQSDGSSSSSTAVQSSHSPAPASPSAAAAAPAASPLFPFTLWSISSRAGGGGGEEAVALQVLLYIADGCLCYCDAAAAGHQSLPLSSISQLSATRELPLVLASRVASDRLLLVFAAGGVWTLEAATVEDRDAFFKLLHQALLQAGRRPQHLTPAGPQLPQQHTAFSSPAGQPPPHSASPAVAAFAPQPIVPPSSSSSSSHHRSRSVDVNSVLRSPTAAAAAVSSAGSPSASSASSPSSAGLSAAVSFLRCGQLLHRYEEKLDLNGHNAVERRPVVLFLNSASLSASPLLLCWCPPASFSASAPPTGSSCLPVRSVSLLSPGRDFGLFRSLLIKCPPDRCLSLVSAAAHLYLEATSAAHREQLLQALHAVITASAGRGRQQPLQHEGVNGALPLSASPAAAAASMDGLSLASSPSPLSLSSPGSGAAVQPSQSPSHPSSSSPAHSEFKHALALLTSGAVFHLYSVDDAPVNGASSSSSASVSSSGPVVARRAVFVFFESALGDETPGCLYWCEPGLRLRLPQQRLVLNTTKRMALGRESAVWQTAAAAKVSAGRCLSITSSSGLTLHLEASSGETRDAWQRSLHLLLIRNGLQASETSKPAATQQQISTQHRMAQQRQQQQQPQQQRTQQGRAEVQQQQQAAASGWLSASGQDGGDVEDQGLRLPRLVQPSSVAADAQSAHPVESPAFPSASGLPPSPVNLPQADDGSDGEEAVAAGSLLTADSPVAVAAWTPSSSPLPPVPPLPSPASVVSVDSAAHVRSLPTSDGSVRSAGSRTIQFSDPTDFFVLQAKIGEGSYGSVYRALDVRDNSAVAIKVLPFDGRDNSRASLKLRKEIKILRRCESPFIVGYKGAFQKGSSVWIAMQFCFDPTVCVWLADGSSKRVDQLLPTDQLLDELGEAIGIVPNSLIGTVTFPQPLPGQPGHATGSLLPTPAQGGYVPPPGTTTNNPGYLNKRRIEGSLSGFTPFIVSDNHQLTVGTKAPARPGSARVRRAKAYHFPEDCKWQVGQAPANMVGLFIPGYRPQTRQRGGHVAIRPFYWGGGVDKLTGAIYQGGHANGHYRDPRAGPVPVGGWSSEQAAMQTQVLDWNLIHQLPAHYRLGEYPVNVIEKMPPAIKGYHQSPHKSSGLLSLVKLSVPVVFPVNSYLVQKLDLAMLDTGLHTGTVDGVDYTLHAYPRLFFRAAQLERALRLTAAAQPGVYAFADAAAVVDRGVMDEQNYRDASQAVRAAILAAQNNPLVAAPANPYQMMPYANPNPYQAIFPPTSADLHALPTVAARVQALVEYMAEVTAWVAGIWLTDGDSSGLFITQSLHTELGMAAAHLIPNDHAAVFERCQHWAGLLGLAAHFALVPAGLGHGANQLPSTSIYFHVVPPGLQIDHANILRNLLRRCGVVVLPIVPPGLTQAQRNAVEIAAEQLNKPRFWDAALPNRLGWQNETVRTRRAFLAGIIDGDGTREPLREQWSIVQEVAKAEGVAWWTSLFRQLGFSTGQPALDPSGAKMVMPGIVHHFTDQRLLPIAILHKRTVGAGRRPESPHTATFRILHDDEQGVQLARGPVVSFTVQKPGRPCSHRLLLADGTITHNCAGGSLSDVMQACGHTFSERQIAAIMRMALQGLAALHRVGVIHRDIKGGNLLADGDGVCKLADFGVSSTLNNSLGRQKTVIGTPHWMAPEVLQSDEYNELADIWGLGITAYELAIGEPPHARLHSMRAAVKIPQADPPQLPDADTWSNEFHSFLASCLIKDPTRRPSAEQLLQHPFVVQASQPSVLLPMIERSIAWSSRKMDRQRRSAARGQHGSGQEAAAAAPDDTGADRTQAAAGGDEQQQQQQLVPELGAAGRGFSGSSDGLLSGLPALRRASPTPAAFTADVAAFRQQRREEDRERQREGVRTMIDKELSQTAQPAPLQEAGRLGAETRGAEEPEAGSPVSTGSSSASLSPSPSFRLHEQQQSDGAA